MGAAVKVDVGKRRELLMGCGHRRQKLLSVNGRYDWEGVVTLDSNPDVNPDVVHDLERYPLPFEDGYFDEIHAYEVLEHLGRQGDYQGFFAEFTEYWRILKPDGIFIATVPRWEGMWAWSDPGHRRIISEGTLTFLVQKAYQEAPEKNEPMTDYRNIYKADFTPIHVDKTADHLIFALQAIKPSRIQEGR